MIAALLAVAARSAAMLTLDLRPYEEACPAATAESDIVVCARGKRLTDRLPVTIDGTPATLVIDPGGSEDIQCNPAFIVRAHLSASRAYPLAQVGPVEIEGTSTDASIVVLSKRLNRRVQWSRYDAIRDADCITGPGALPFDRVRFLIGKERPDAQAQSLPFHRPSYGHTNAAWRVGRNDVAVRFTHLQRRTVLAASSTQVVAATLGATAVGPVLQDEIAWSIERPVRALRMNTPIVVAGLTIRQPYSRVRDYGDTTDIRTVDAQDIQTDDIVVAAKRRKPGGTRLMRIGRDDLGRCVSLTVDNRARRITLLC